MLGGTTLLYSPRICPVLTLMLSLYDLLEIVEDERKLQKWLEKYKIVIPRVAECPSCGSRMREADNRGKPGWMCSSKDCRRRVSNVSGGILEGSNLSPKQFLMLAYFWAHDCGGVRAVEMLGHGPTTVAGWSARFRQCVLNQQDATVQVLGGRDKEVRLTFL